MNTIYFDNSASAIPCAQALGVFAETAKIYANPSSLHSAGLHARRIIENARAKAAAAFRCQSGELVFTSGGTESNNTAVRGLALLACGGNPVTGLSPEYRALAAGSILGVPTIAVFTIVVIIICAFVANKTVYGRRVYSCGGNLEAARVSGINTNFIRISTFAIAGLLAGLCGFLMTSRVTIGQPTAGESYEMDAITACVVGGVSMSGGVGKPSGVIIGTLLITVIANGLDILGVSAYWQKIIKGLIIVAAVLIDVKRKSKKA